ncbi:MAG: site-specific DNA-methyltransferase [Verrucomicrobiota bacterium]
MTWQPCSRGYLYEGDVSAGLKNPPSSSFQTIIADPPYFQVQTDEGWDNQWASQEEYLTWIIGWVEKAFNHLSEDGIFYIFGQPGKREHIFLSVCAELSQRFAFHDLIVWDRAVGYNERRDSFTPQFEMILALKKTSSSHVYFNKDAVRIPYNKETIRKYAADKRYKDPEARMEHLRKGKYATNILRFPSLKGQSKEKVGHPTQKPIALIEALVLSSSSIGDWILDPFLGSGTTAAAAEKHGRKWAGIEKDPDYCEVIRKRVKKTEQ